MALRSLVFAFTAGLLVGAGPAAAVEDLTGTWDAKLSCKGIHAGSKGKQKTTAELVIADLGGGQVLFDMGAYPNGAAYVLTETNKPGNGVLSGLTCFFDALSRDGFLLRADVKTKAGSDKATLKGTLIIFEEPDAESATCKISAKRVSTLAPKLPGCIPL